MSVIKRAVRLFRRYWAKIKLRNRICGLGRKINKDAVIIGLPDHSNIGDMAIGVAEKAFLKSCGISCVALTGEESYENLPMLKRVIKPSTLICYIGGGNLGNVYEFEERVRRAVISEFPENPSVIFPQTIYYTPDDKGEREAEKTSQIFGEHKKLTIALRDECSLEKAKKMFPSANVIFSPDIVMHTSKDTFGVKNGERNGVLLCFRGDCERSMTQTDKEKLALCLEERGIAWRNTDTIAEFERATQRRQRLTVAEKIRELSEAGLVITDRLHGMIFSAIAETPCIVFGNYNHKVEQSYKMLEHLEYIKFVKSVDEAIALVGEMYGNVGHYDRSPILPRYEQLKNTLLDYTRKQ